jgi:hypothetical protein
MSLFLLVLVGVIFPVAFAQAQQLTILSHNGFPDNNEFLPTYHIVGEVQNNGTSTAKFVQISATLYDSNNQVIGTGNAFTNPADIEPSQKAPFEVLVTKDSVKGGDLSLIDHYAVQVSGQS